MLPVASDVIRGREGSFVIVVSPLIALINDQVEAFCAKGLKAVHYHSGIDEANRTDVSAGKFQLLFTSPETLLHDKEFRDYLECDYYQEHLIGLIIDEAHCVKNWYVYVPCGSVHVYCVYIYHPPPSLSLPLPV